MPDAAMQLRASHTPEQSDRVETCKRALRSVQRGTLILPTVLFYQLFGENGVIVLCERSFFPTFLLLWSTPVKHL